MAATSGGFSAQFDFKLKRGGRLVGGICPPSRSLGLELRKRWKRRARERVGGVTRISCCCSSHGAPIRRATGSGKSVEKIEEWRFDPKKSPQRVRIQASPAMPFASSQWVPTCSCIFIYLSLYVSVHAVDNIQCVSILSCGIVCTLNLNSNILFG